MANRKLRKISKNLLSASMALVLMISLCSCADAVRTLRVIFDEDYGDSDDDDGRAGRHNRNVPTDETCKPCCVTPMSGGPWGGVPGSCLTLALPVSSPVCLRASPFPSGFRFSHLSHE